MLADEVKDELIPQCYLWLLCVHCLEERRFIIINIILK